MMYVPEIREAAGDPEALEALYKGARHAKGEAAFREALQACYERAPDNLLYAAWHVRLREAGQDRDRGAAGGVNWKLAVPLSLLLGLLFWVLTAKGLELPDGVPYLALAWTPLAAWAVMAFLSITARSSGKHGQVQRAVMAGAGLLAALAYVTAFVALRERQHYTLLMILHLPLLAWIGVGLYLLGWGARHRDRFVFVIKSIEVFITAGLFAGAGGAFSGITIGMFEALGISLPEAVMRLLFAGGGGLIPVLAVAITYDPRLSPIAQRLQQGLGKIIATLMRLMLPLALLVLLAYLAAIPFNFMEPFENRDTLIVYNVMLFAVMGLVVGATPVQETDLASGHQRVLRIGILAVSVLATLVSLYALSAVVYRTVQGGFTVNRVAVIGWNTINVGILVLLVVKQIRAGAERWLDAAQAVYGWGMRAYAAWTTFLVVLVPLLFSER
jgi:hypothetical protein